MNDTLVSVLIGVIKSVVFVYDVLTYPVYFVAQKPWDVRREAKKVRAEVVDHDEGLTYRSTAEMGDMMLTIKKEGIETMHELVSYAVSQYKHKKLLGTRQILAEEDEQQPDGRKFKKFVLGDYDWWNFSEVDKKAEHFGRGLRELGQEPKMNIVIFAETRREWLVSAIACFKQNIPVVTIYATLGDEAIVYGVNQTEVTHIITSHELLPKFKNIFPQCPNVKHIIYMEGQLGKTDTSGYKDDVTIHTFNIVVDKGADSSLAGVPPSPDDTCILMYTSGSTGTPKGVILTHKNIVSSLGSFTNILHPQPDDVYISVLPLAHVLELIAESMMLISGIAIGYSTALTMTDKSSKVKSGCKGDATVLRPTLMCVVPLILDRIYKAIKDNVNKSGPFGSAFFNFATQYKTKWSRSGHDTPILNRIIFRKLRALVGGRVRLMASGGAPLSPDTHDFIRATMCVPLYQGYGLTETCACATAMDDTDLSTARVGQPLMCTDIKLVDWDEGNYRITDTPHPRGEIVLGGDNVAQGYYKLEDKTKEDFFDLNGRRWFKTGDIGEMHEDGVLKIIDRKKDLVKLQFGEYVSLGKVESSLKTVPVVENICIYGDPTKMFTVALVVPVEAHLKVMAEQLGIAADQSFEKLCEEPKLADAVLKELVAAGKKSKLAKFEVPGVCHLCSELWSPENGLVTAAFKLRRKPIEQKYRDDIDRMYLRSPGST